MAQASSKKEKRAQQAQERTRKKIVRPVVVGVLMAAVAIFAAWSYFRPTEQLGEHFASMGRTHVPQNTPVPKYNSSPPTSGPHAGPARWEDYAAEISELNQVHNLEHGGIVIQYNCALLPAGESCTKVRTALREITAKARREIDRKIILAPYSKMPRPIAVTAWRRLQYFDAVDEAGILRFADAFINKGPEFVP